MKQPELGRKIFELRQKKGLTQEELVSMCNINVRTIQRIESGEVAPRKYTVKTILHALGENLEQFHKTKRGNNLHFPSIDLGNIQKSELIQLQLKVAWLSGIIYFVIGFMEFAADWSRYYEDEFIFGEYGYIAIKLMVLICYSLFMRGFLIVGNVCEKYLLKFSSVLLIILGVAYYVYDIISVYLNILDVDYVLISSSIFFGMSGMVFGYSILKLEESFGVLATVTGGLTIASSFFLFTVFLGWLGLIFLIPTVLIQIILLYKFVHLVQLKSQEY